MWFCAARPNCLDRVRSPRRPADRSQVPPRSRRQARRWRAWAAHLPVLPNDVALVADHHGGIPEDLAVRRVPLQYGAHDHLQCARAATCNATHSGRLTPLCEAMEPQSTGSCHCEQLAHIRHVHCGRHSKVVGVVGHHVVLSGEALQQLGGDACLGALRKLAPLSLPRAERKGLRSNGAREPPATTSP